MGMASFPQGCGCFQTQALHCSWVSGTEASEEPCGKSISLCARIGIHLHTNWYCIMRPAPCVNEHWMSSWENTRKKKKKKLEDVFAWCYLIKWRMSLKGNKSVALQVCFQSTTFIIQCSVYCFRLEKTCMHYILLPSEVTDKRGLSSPQGCHGNFYGMAQAAFIGSKINLHLKPASTHTSSASWTSMTDKSFLSAQLWFLSLSDRLHKWLNSEVKQCITEGASCFPKAILNIPGRNAQNFVPRCFKLPVGMINFVFTIMQAKSLFYSKNFLTGFHFFFVFVIQSVAQKKKKKKVQVCD